MNRTDSTDNVEYKSGAAHLDTISDIKEIPFEEIHEEVVLTEEERKKLRWKLDIRLIPALFLLYFVNLIDRAAVGASTGFGFRQSLGLRGNQYNIGVSIFFVFYCLCEIPSNLLLKKVGGKIWLPAIAIAYGACTLGTAFIRNYGHFIVVRIVLGITECGTTPGITYFLSTWYDRHELSFRVPFFLGAGILSTGIGPFLANGYLSLGRISSQLVGWRIIFFCNAIITFGTAIIAYFILPETPEKTKMLNERERAFILARSKRLTAGRTTEEGTTLHLIGRAFKHPYVFFGTVYLFCANIVASTLTYFLAIVMTEDFGYTGTKANVYLGIVFLTTFVYNVIVGAVSSKFKIHAPIILWSTLLGIVGAAMFMYGKGSDIRYGGAFLAAFAAYGMANVAQGWYPSNIAPFTTRATACGIPPAVGSLGGIVSAWVFIPAQRVRGYPNGRIILLSFASFGCICIILQTLYIRWENQQRANGKRDWRLENITREQEENLGSLHPHFRYTY